MSQRERWIIYPLLFFCFSMSIKLYWYPDYREIDAKGGITCRSLLVQDENGLPVLRIDNEFHRTPQVVLYSAPPSDAAGKSPVPVVRLTVSPQGRGVVESLSELGAPMVQLSGDATSGTIALFDPTGGSIVKVHKPTAPPSENPRAAPVRPPVPAAESESTTRASAVGSNPS